MREGKLGETYWVMVLASSVVMVNARIPQNGQSAGAGWLPSWARGVAMGKARPCGLALGAPAYAPFCSCAGAWA